MKLKHRFETMALDGEVIGVVVDSADDARVMLRMNGSAADILSLLREETTEDAVVAGMCAQYDADEPLIRKTVHECIETLRSDGLLLE